MRSLATIPLSKIRHRLPAGGVGTAKLKVQCFYVLCLLFSCPLQLSPASPRPFRYLQRQNSWDMMATGVLSLLGSAARRSGSMYWSVLEIRRLGLLDLGDAMALSYARPNVADCFKGTNRAPGAIRVTTISALIRNWRSPGTAIMDSTLSLWMSKYLCRHRSSDSSIARTIGMVFSVSVSDHVPLV